MVCKSFFPIGTGTGTPLILHPIWTTECEIRNGDSEKSRYHAIFLHKPSAIYYDFDNVKREIEN